MKSLLRISLLLIIHIFFFGAIPTKSLAAFGPTDKPSQVTVLEELSAQLQKNGRAVEIEGAIKNISKSVLKGYVTVYLLDENGGVINAKDKAIGNGLDFSQGMIAKFTVTMKIGRKKKVESISVDFVQE